MESLRFFGGSPGRKKTVLIAFGKIPGDYTRNPAKTGLVTTTNGWIT